MLETKARSLGNTEQNWCRAVSSGTGITVLALQIAKTPSEIPLLHKVLRQLQINHPLLCFKIDYDSTTKDYSFLKSTTPPQIRIQIHDIPTTSNLLKQNPSISPMQVILEHELNATNWSDPCRDIEVISASMYSLSDSKRSVVVLRFHAAICDRTTAVTLLRELMELAEASQGGGETRTQMEIDNTGEGSLGIESATPKRMKKKTVWARGVDMLGYSMSSFMLTNLKFQSSKCPRRSEVVRLQMDATQTARLLAGCKSRGMKLCGALAAAALMAAHSTKLKSDQLKKKYGVVTLTDCRSYLEPPLSTQHFGYYHSVVLNIQTVKGDDEIFWDLAGRCYIDFAQDKKCNKHLTDMSDLNFLMCKAIENPTLTPSASLRTSLVSVFEEPVFDNSSKIQQNIGVQDYIGCASVHGIGPSIALFDTIRDGALDCACVYPSPLHSREQMSGLVGHMKKILIDQGMNDI